MAVKPFTANENPTMAAFNERFASILTDATAGKFNGDGNTTPDDILSILSASALYDGAGGLVDVLGNVLKVGAQIETGSYVGTGTYGADNPCSLTFGFEPLLVFSESYANGNGVQNHYGTNDAYIRSLLPVYKLNTSYIGGGRGRAVGLGYGGTATTDYRLYAKRSEDGKTIYWYNEYNAQYQNNNANQEYTWVAIG